MRIAFLTLIMIAIAGCGTLEERPQALYKSFDRYHAAVGSGSVVARRAEFFTPAALKGIDISSKSDVVELSIGSYIGKERSHYEEIHEDRGCLTVNGYQGDGDPVSLFIEYKPVEGKWLMNYTNVHLPQRDRFKGFFEKALCPDEAQEDIMREFNQGK